MQNLLARDWTVHECETQNRLPAYVYVPYTSRFLPGGGDSDMKWTGMLVVSLRGVSFGFWSRLGCSGQNVIIFSRQGLV